MAGELRVLFRDPQKMIDRATWAHHSFQCDLWPVTGSLVHDCTLDSFRRWDSAAKHLRERHAREMHVALFVHMDDELDQLPGSFLELLSWFIAAACFAHHGHQALKWSIWDFSDDTCMSSQQLRLVS